MTDGSVLIIDDNPINLKLARLVLSDGGYEVQTARSAAEARALLAQVEPKLILMDLHMPTTDGLTLTRELRQARRFDSTWIVALTAYAMPGDAEGAYAAGCDGYVTKPIDTEALPATVASFLARARGVDAAP